MKMTRQSIGKKKVYKLAISEQVVGKWHKNVYLIISQLGYGATGTVYLAKSHGGLGDLVALKIAPDTMNITSEVNVLRQLTQAKVQAPRLGPSFYDVDDYVTPKGTFPFYVMEYIVGEPFLPFVRKKGGEWLGILLIQLLNDLHDLHQSGWVFGDIKPENLIVEKKGNQLRWLDPGGMTKHGRSIKEYTEFFDRGYWGLGDRRAEPSYDLFSVSMLIINQAYPARFEKSESHNDRLLMKKVQVKDHLLPYSKVFQKGIAGKYRNALEMRKDLMYVVNHYRFSTQGSKQVRRRSIKQLKTVKRPKKWVGVIESIMVASFLLTLYILYLFGQGF